MRQHSSERSTCMVSFNRYFLAQKGMDHIMSTKLISIPQSIHSSRLQIDHTVPPRSDPAASASRGGSRSASQPNRTPSGMSSAGVPFLEAGRNGGRISAPTASISGQAGHNSSAPAALAAPAAHILPQARMDRPSCSSPRSGNVVPFVLRPRISRNFDHFPASDRSDSAYSEWFVKHSFPHYLSQLCSATFTISDCDFLFKGNFVNPATSSDWAEVGKAHSKLCIQIKIRTRELKLEKHRLLRELMRLSRFTWMRTIQQLRTQGLLISDCRQQRRHLL